MEKIETFINLETIKGFLADKSDEFSEQLLQEFIEYLEVDFYDWLNSNLNTFSIDKQSNIKSID